jgi:hypothetical protein
MTVAEGLLKRSMGNHVVQFDPPSPSDPFNATENDTGTSEEAVSPRALSPPDDTDSSRSYRMPKNFKSIDDIWDWWHGIEMFQDELGGVKGRNKQFGAKWRNHMEGQCYSRTKCIVDAISAYAERNQLRIREATALINDWFVDPTVRQSLTKMKQLCIKKEILKKGKARGNQCKKAEVQDNTMEE